MKPYFNERMIYKIYLKNKLYIKGFCVISPLIKIRSWRWCDYNCITAFTFAVNKGHNVLTNQKPVYIFHLSFWSVFCLHSMHNMQVDWTKQFLFKSFPWWIFCVPIKKLFVFTLNVSSFEKRPILLL